MAKDCWSKKKMTKSNATTSKTKNQSDDERDVIASFAAEEELALAVTVPGQINYEKDWIVDSGCSNHMIGDEEKLWKITEYKGGHVVVTANNSRLLIAHIGKTTIVPHYGPNEIPLQEVYHIPSMKRNLLSVA